MKFFCQLPPQEYSAPPTIEIAHSRKMASPRIKRFTQNGDDLPHEILLDEFICIILYSADMYTSISSGCVYIDTYISIYVKWEI